MSSAVSHDQADSDLALAMKLQEQFDEEYAASQQDPQPSQHVQHENWKQINDDEAYARHLQTLINNDHIHTAPSTPSHAIHEDEKLYSQDYEFSEEELQKHDEKNKEQASYFHFENEEEEGPVPPRKNFNLDKDQKDRFSLSDHMKKEFPNTSFNQNVVEQLNNVEKMQDKTRIRRKDKKHKATVENVLDHRTRLLLFRMINNPEMQLEAMHGCVSTGKEANVYFGESGDQNGVAVKVYKTSMLQFRDRDRYVSGEFKFRRGYSKSNARKMVEKWANKEFSNMHKLYRAGIPCPKPFDQVKHVFVMEFFGKDGWPAKRLKDAHISKKKLMPLYRQLVKIMRDIYQKAKLVHADLSEYNILYCQHKPYIIDVSQSVSHDHPNALEFLRSDAYNVTQFFLGRGLKRIMTIRELFDFIVSQTIPDSSVDKYLDNALAEAEERGDLDTELHTDDAVFKQAYIPRTLHQVENFEQHFQSVQEGTENTDELFYRKVVGLNMDLSGIDEIPEYLKEEEGEEEEESPDEKLDDKEAEQFEIFSNDLGKMLGAMERKERKQYVKQMKRAKRETKIPKAERQRAKILTKRRKGQKV